MEEKLNIAAILRDKQNVRIYDLLHNIYVKLDSISTTDGETVIWCTKEYPDKTSYFGYSELGTERGWLDGLQILKPSKEMQDWSKFAWKKGDVLRCGVDNLCIFESWANNNYTEFNAMYVTHSYANSTCPTKMWTKETNEDTIKQYISKIEEIKGGKLNLSTLTIEKQPKFKDGDFVTVYYSSKDRAIIIFKHDESDSKFYYYCALIKGKLYYDDYVVASSIAPRFYSKSEKEEFFAALANENKAWDAEKKVIVDLPKKCELKAFDRVLVRNGNVWRADIFSNKTNESFPYRCVGGMWKKCIPYNDSTKRLLGTTDNWEGGNNE